MTNEPTYYKVTLEELKALIKAKDYSEGMPVIITVIERNNTLGNIIKEWLKWVMLLYP